MKHKIIFSLLVVAAVFIAAMSAYASESRTEQATAPVTYVEESEENTLQKDTSSEILSPSRLRLNEFRHSESYPRLRVAPESCFQHVEDPVLNKLPEYNQFTYPDYHCKITSQTLHYFARLNI